MSEPTKNFSGKRASQETDDSHPKKARKGDEDGARNPYLAHMYEQNDAGAEEPSPNSPFAGFKRRHTTAKQAEKVENLDQNPFNGQGHSQKYFQILETRRNLPVHKQR